MFIVLEGIDGSGKTTVAKELYNYLVGKDFKVILTREPTDGPIGRFIRNYIFRLSQRNPLIEALLFASDRLWHNENIIKPNLSKVDYIISDRYIYSSLAYQTNSEISEGFIYLINKGIVFPKYAFFIDVKPETAFSRINHAKNIFEELNFLKRVYSKYVDLSDRGFLIRIPGQRDAKDIMNDILSYILKK
ncbi:dTMP kinase [Candidatus Geothermarchaeota archaeon]|nr:MAG: dTMP kinase [Candidatus Geothermarchaeota archaeon]